MSDEYILGTATPDAIANLERLRQQASQTKTPVFDSTNKNNKMLFFAFDGTGDNKDNGSLGAPSNVGRLFESAQSGLRASSSGDAFYYKGPGTQDDPVSRVLDGATGMTVPQTVATAYQNLVEYANLNPDTILSIGTTGFSRGAATARAFMNAVYEQGILDTSSRVSLGIDPHTNEERFSYTKYLVEPHEAKLAVAMLYDTVATGVARDESLMRIPPVEGLKVYQLAVVGAMLEARRELSDFVPMLIRKEH